MESNPYLEGQVVLIDKPLEWTSFDVVNKLRYQIKRRYKLKKIKVGHAGTLDPLATGLLIVCTGRETKNINTYMGAPKTYTGRIRLGSTTPSYDLETEVDAEFPIDHIDDELIEQVKEQFVGDILQKPPIFSAIKLDGKKAYESARAGKEIEMEARAVHIERLDLSRESENTIYFEVRCSKGTYIRSLAHDLGKALKSGAHLIELRRTAIGELHVSDAIDPTVFVDQLYA